MPHADVRKGHPGAQGPTSARVAAPHHRRGRVARGMEAGDRATALVDDSAELVGHQAALGADVTRINADGVERPLLKRAEVRVRCMGGIAPAVVEDTLAAAEVLVLPLAGEAVEAFDRALK